MLFKRIAIVGVGLIGGSFALAARRAKLAERITGCGGSGSAERALAAGVIDEIERSFDEGSPCKADLIYLAAPVGGIIEFLMSRGRFAGEGAIITDAGSTKRAICRAAESLNGGATFVGGHPMAGSHKTGIDSAKADLFEGAPYGLIKPAPRAGSDRQAMEAFEKVVETVRGIGASPIVISAQDHDHVVARTSHVPQLLSTALALGLKESGALEKAPMAGSGLRTMSRLAGSSWSVWEDICRTNGDEIGSALGEIIATLEGLKEAVDARDFGGLADIFGGANSFARNLQGILDRDE